MKKWFKTDGYKVFYVAAFLFITIFFILPYLVQVSTYFHEKGHQTALDKHGVDNSYRINLLTTIHNFYNPNVKKLGVTKFDIDAYGELNKFQKAEINIAGVISDLRFLFLISVYLVFVNIFMFYKIRVRKDYDLVWILAVNWILFMWLLALVQITTSNLTFSSGDFISLVKSIG
tara:strand:+ start:865 stop:1386 length:522 start_codon:yes stop_codon:yes gene_type:complete